jgi:hypothetical protein
MKALFLLKQVDVDIRPRTPRLAAQFDWEKQWYPLFFVEDINGLPQKVQLLGKWLKLWQHEEGTWRCSEEANASSSHDAKKSGDPHTCLRMSFK